MYQHTEPEVTENPWSRLTVVRLPFYRTTMVEQITQLTLRAGDFVPLGVSV